MRTPEEVTREIVQAVGLGGSPDDAEEVYRLIRARDAEVAEFTKRWEDVKSDVVRAWIEPGINPPYHERMKARVRKIMPTLARHLDEKAKDAR